MNKFPFRGLPPLLLLGLMSVSLPATALQATANASLGMDFTDNATKTGSNEIDEQIFTAQVGGTLAKTEGAATGDAIFSLSHQDYLDNTYGNRNYLKLGSSLSWEAVENLVDVRVQDYFTQTAVDNLAVDVPTNRQNTNLFSISSGISYPLSGRHRLSFSPSFSKYTYNKSDADNQQMGLSGGWFYKFRPTMEFSLNGGVSRVEQDSSSDSDYDSRNITLGVSGTTVHMRYRASLGKNWVDSGALADNSGVTGSLSMDFDVSGRSSLKVRLLQAITNSSALSLGTFIDPATGDITNIQVSGQAVRNRSVRISYDRSGSTVNSSVWTEVRELDYDSSASDRDTREIGARLGYSVTPLINATLSGRFKRNEQTGSSLDQDEWTIKAGLGYSLSRRMGVNFSLGRNSRDTSDGSSDYDEFSLGASLGYSFWP